MLCITQMLQTLTSLVLILLLQTFLFTSSFSPSLLMPFNLRGSLCQPELIAYTVSYFCFIYIFLIKYSLAMRRAHIVTKPEVHPSPSSFSLPSLSTWTVPGCQFSHLPPSKCPGLVVEGHHLRGRHPCVSWRDKTTSPRNSDRPTPLIVLGAKKSSLL